MTREDFEILSSKKQKSYADRIEAEQRKEFRNSYHKCFICPKKAVTEHHVWFKSQCRIIWYYFQKINKVPICEDCHTAVHDKGIVFEVLEERKQLVIEDSKKYKEQFTYKG